LAEKIYGAAENIVENYEKPIDAGVLLTHDEIRTFLRISGEWFAMKQLTPFELLRFFVTRKTAYAIICRAYNALEKIKSAKSYDDTEKDNYPIRIVLPDTDLATYMCPKCKKSGLEHECYS